MVKILRDLESDDYHFVNHPVLNTPSTKALRHKGYVYVVQDRQEDTDLLTSKRMKDVIDEVGIHIISYSNLLGLED